MGRKNRREIEHAGAIYHIIIKGIEGIDIFTDDFDRKKYISMLRKMIKEYKIHLFSFVLMDNHVHLLLKTEKDNLSKAMQFLNSSYAHWFNYKHIRKGHLFQDRYKSYLIQKTQYLLSVASYISLNPVDAGMVDTAEPEKFRWSSFFYCTPSQRIPPWLYISEMLQLCELNLDDFVNFVRTNSLKKKKDLDVLLNQLTESNQASLPKNINHLINKLKQYFGDINTNKKLRNLLIFFLAKEGYKIKEIAELFQISRQSVCKINNNIRLNLSSEPIYLLWLNNIKTCLSI